MCELTKDLIEINGGADVSFDVYTFCWNEEHLLPIFLKHYNQARKIIIYDNESTDNSRKIIEEAGREMRSFVYENENSYQTVQTNLKNIVWKESKNEVDFVIIHDLNEFVYFPMYPNDLKSGLRELKLNNITASYTTAYNVVCSDDDFETVRKYVYPTTIFYEGYREIEHDKPVLFRPNGIIDSNYLLDSSDWSPVGNLEYGNNFSRPLLLRYEHIGKKFEMTRRKLINDNKNRINKTDCVISDEEIEQQINLIHQNKKIIFYDMFPDCVTITNPCNNVSFFIDTFGNGDGIGASLFNGEVWEPAVSSIINIITKNNIFIDMGANIGLHAVNAAISGAKTYAIECHPRTVQKLKNTCYYNNINESTFIIIDKAASDTSVDIVNFTENSNNLGASYISATHTGDKPENMKQIMVETLRLDDYPFDFDLNKKIIVKMDIEGHELNALHGMNKILTNPQTFCFIIELNPSTQKCENLMSIVDLLNLNSFTDMRIILDIPEQSWAGPQDTRFTDVESIYNILPKVEIPHIQSLLTNYHILEVMFSKSL